VTVLAPEPVFGTVRRMAWASHKLSQRPADHHSDKSAAGLRADCVCNDASYGMEREATASGSPSTPQHH
jgi:hypothetical protein